MPAQKIATCCYCGSRAALVLRGHERQELACSNCGAPLHDLKMLRVDRDGPRELVKPSSVRRKTKKKREDSKHHRAPDRRRYRKRRKGFGRWVLEEAWDVLEDIFD